MQSAIAVRMKIASRKAEEKDGIPTPELMSVVNVCGAVLINAEEPDFGPNGTLSFMGYLPSDCLADLKVATPETVLTKFNEVGGVRCSFIGKKGELLPADIFRTPYGTTTDIFRDKKGRIHRDGNEPAVFVHAKLAGRETPFVGKEEYYRHGDLHRDCGPAMRQYSPETGAPIMEWFAKEGHIFQASVNNKEYGTEVMEFPPGSERLITVYREKDGKRVYLIGGPADHHELSDPDVPGPGAPGFKEPTTELIF